MHKKNLWFVLALVAVLVAVIGLVAACGSSDETTTTAVNATTTTAAPAGETTTTGMAEDTTTTAAAGAPQGGTLAYYIGDPSYIDPTNCFESEGTQVVQALFDSLTAIDYKTAAQCRPPPTPGKPMRTVPCGRSTSIRGPSSATALR